MSLPSAALNPTLERPPFLRRVPEEGDQRPGRYSDPGHRDWISPELLLVVAGATQVQDSHSAISSDSHCGPHEQVVWPEALIGVPARAAPEIHGARADREKDARGNRATCRVSRAQKKKFASGLNMPHQFADSLNAVRRHKPLPSKDVFELIVIFIHKARILRLFHRDA